MEKTILNITLDEKDMITVKIPDQDMAVKVITDVICDQLASRRYEALNILFAVTVHLLARDTSERFQKDYIDNIEKTVPAYREHFKKTIEKTKTKIS